MKFPFYQVDAFAVKPFKGNPAAVFLLESAREDSWLQAVAEEINLPETAFLLPKGHDYQLRWFTPTTEVDLCGHATIASAHILYEFGYYDFEETINFHTRSGIITSTFNRGTIELDMPRLNVKPCPMPDDLLIILGAEPVTTFVSDANTLIAEMPSAEYIRSFVPDFKKIEKLDFEGLTITAPSDDPRFDFISRYFSPRDGIPEDPVTGMAHCALGPYWEAKLGKSNLHAYQASARGGEVWLRVAPNRVFVGGKAVTVLAGEMLRQ